MLYQILIKELKGKNKITLRQSFGIGVGEWTKRDFFRILYGVCRDLIDQYFKKKSLTGDDRNIKLKE